MATHIVELNSFRQAPATAIPGAKQAKAISARRRGVATRKKRNAAAADVVQIPTKANKAQRSEAASARYKEDCEAAILRGTVYAVKNKITGSIVLSATDADGGDFNVHLEGIYRDNAEAALSTLGCLVEYFQERAQKERNDRAMAAAQPSKRTAFEVLL